MALIPASGREVWPARPIVWQRHRTTPWWATTTLNSVGSATMAASGGRGKIASGKIVPPTIVGSNFASGCQRLQYDCTPEKPHSSLTVKAITIVGQLAGGLFANCSREM